MDVQEGFAVPLGEECGLGRSTAELVTQGEDERSVRVSHIPLSALHVVALGSLSEQVLRGNSSVLGLAELRAPAAMGNVVPNSPVQAHAIGAGLASADDFFDHAFLGDVILSGELLNGLDTAKFQKVQKVVPVDAAVLDQFLGQGIQVIRAEDVLILLLAAPAY